MYPQKHRRTHQHLVASHSRRSHVIGKCNPHELILGNGSKSDACLTKVSTHRQSQSLPALLVSAVCFQALLFSQLSPLQSGAHGQLQLSFDTEATPSTVLLSPLRKLSLCLYSAFILSSPIQKCSHMGYIMHSVYLVTF